MVFEEWALSGIKKRSVTKSLEARTARGLEGRSGDDCQSGRHKRYNGYTAGIRNRQWSSRDEPHR